VIESLWRMAESFRTRARALNRDEGLSTAELLGNAALAIAALVVIWGLLQALGVDVIDWIRTKILDG